MHLFCFIEALVDPQKGTETYIPYLLYEYRGACQKHRRLAGYLIEYGPKF